MKFYDGAYPNAGVVSRTTAETGDDLNFVNSSGKITSYAVVDGRRIAPSKSSMKAPNSIIQMEFDGDLFVGQVTDIFSHRQKVSTLGIINNFISSVFDGSVRIPLSTQIFGTNSRPVAKFTYVQWLTDYNQQPRVRDSPSGSTTRNLILRKLDLRRSSIQKPSNARPRHGYGEPSRV